MAVMESQRSFALDVFRGMTIAAMILVNNPGSWSHVYPPLLHAAWHGWTPTDLIFPFFLFIAGMALAFSLGSHLEKGESRKALVAKIGRRALILFGLGLFLQLFPFFNFSNLRIPGVLQRIALCYLFSALLFLKLKWRGLVAVSLVVLIGYWLALLWIPVPGFGAGNLSPDGNLAAYVDRLVLKGTRLYRGTWDPEGALSTFPAAVTMILGILSGIFLRKNREMASSRKWNRLMLAGFLGIMLGLLWSLNFPLNKNLWTSSYVLFTAGLALLLFACCFWICDIQCWRAWAKSFLIFGTNSIAVFFLSGLLSKTLILLKVGNNGSVYSWIYQHFFASWAGLLNGSLFFAIAYVLFWLAIMALFYRKGIFVKI